MTKIQLAHYEIDLADRYAAGSIINAEEAKVLNVARAERIRNRLARWLDNRSPEKEILVGDDLADFRAYAQRTDETYEFTTRDAPRPKRGSLDAEIREIAQERAEALARERGRGADEALIGELFENLLVDPEVEALAKTRLEARHQIAKEGFASL